MSQFLTSDGQIIASALNAASAAAWCQESISAQDEQAAIAAILVGRDGRSEAIAGLTQLLDDDNLQARAAAWALGQLQASAELLNKALDGSLDERENAYNGLCIFLGKFFAEATAQSLEEQLQKALEAELERAQSGRTGLCEYACRALATIGADNCAEAIQRVIDSDPLTDRYELQRLRKELDDSGYDRETRELAAAPWDSYFADELADESQLAQTDVDEPDSVNEAPLEDEVAPSEAEEIPPIDESVDSVEEAEEPSEPPLDIAGYAGQFEDPEAPDLRLLQQVIPMLNQLSEQAVKIPLQSLGAQEFAVLILQVLPQALPPQYLQALLTPDALNALSRFFRWHQAQGHASDLLEGLNLVRAQLQEQVRASGMLGGPDFSDPDEVIPDSE